MSLTQRAKKRFFGSISKRKKVKISTIPGNTSAGVLRTRPPIPEFLSPSPSFDDPVGHLQASTSLPDQLDQSGISDIDAVSYQSCLHLESATFSLKPVQRADVSSSNDQLTDDYASDSTSCLSSDEIISNHGDILHHTDRSVTTAKNTLDFRIHSTGHSDDGTPDVRLMQKTNEQNNTCQQEGSITTSIEPESSKLTHKRDVPKSHSTSSVEGILTEHLDGDKFVNSLFSDIIDTYNYSGNAYNSELAATSENKSLLDDFEINDDVFSPTPDDLTTSALHKPSSTMQFENSSDNTNQTGNSNGINSQYGNNSTEETANNIMKTDSNEGQSDAHEEPRADSFVLKQIRFFENYNDSTSSNLPNNDSVTKSTVSPNSDIPHATTNLLTPNSAQKKPNFTPLKTKSVSFSDRKGETSNTFVKLPKQVSSFRVFKNSAFSNPRLNFSPFKRSGSIPEVLAMCSCGQYCEGECSARVATTVKDGRRRVHSNGGIRGIKINPDQICHHPQCTDDNNGQPLLLCRQCDLDIHRNREYSGHLVLDIKVKSPGPLRPPSPDVDYEDDSESDTQHPAGEDRTDGVFIKHNSQIRGKTSSTELERKLKRKMALKKKVKSDLDAYLAQIADPEGVDQIQVFTPVSESNDTRFVFDQTNNPSIVSQDSLESLNEDIQVAEYTSLNTKLPVRRQPRVTIQDSHFTLKFRTSEGSRDDLEVVAAIHHTTLREAIEAALLRRNIDVNTINVFIEKSRTPLPLSSDSAFLAGNVLEVKEKCDKDPEIAVQGKSRSSSNKSGTGKGSKQSGRNSRRESLGVVPLLLELPPTKQRRGSLQLPFREHFFNKGESKTAESLKVYDDSFGSLRGRSRSGNLSVDDTFYPASSPGGSWSEAKRGKSPKLSVVNLFTPTNKDKERLDQLSEILNRYSLHGLPPFPELLSLGRPKFDDSIFELEPSWKSIAVNHESLTKKQQEHQEAVWELLLTEVSYIKQIRVIIDVFQNCLINVQQESFLNEIETERLFSNIDKVFECNCMFWQQYLLPILQRGRECRQPLDPLLSKEGFVDHFPSMFQVYFKFFIEHKSCLDYAKSCMENTDLFKIFIQWAEAQKQCNRLKLADILVKPMQRLLKYSLLLQAILRHTENPKDRTDIQEMIQSIDKLCWAANNSLRRREDYEKLEAVRKTIDPFDAIEAPNDECAKIIQEYNGNFNLLAPMPGFRDGPRSLLFHSSLRMKEAQNIKLDVDCLLFTDLILICKSNKRMERFKIIRPPMRLDQLVVSELKDKGSFLLIYMNEYQVPISAFTFHSDIGAVKLWVDKFREAQRDFKMKKIQESAELEIIRKDSIAAQSEVEGTTVLSVPSYLELASTALPRSESTESADRFMPNLLTPNDFPADTGQSDAPRSASAGDFQNHPVTLSTHRDLLPHANTDPKLGNLLSPGFSSMQQSTSESIQGTNSLTAKHKPVQSSRSVPNIMVANNNGTSPGASPPSKQDNQGFKEISHNVDHLSLSTSSQSKDIYHSASEGSLSEQNSISDEEELAKLKLNARRVSRTEKRYHTADAIQDIKNSEKDNSIHKRLSWRTDVAMDHKNLGSKTVSTDSVRSVPSSSGVSSIGSLHLTVDTEISEEQEGNSNDSDNYSGSSPTRNDRLKLFSVGDVEDIDDDDDDEDDDDSNTFADSKQCKSKSTSDLATMFSNSLQVSQIEDGIASVAMSTDNFNRKLTHAEIVKMKKLKHQVLYDANIESSEV